LSFRPVLPLATAIGLVAVLATAAPAGAGAGRAPAGKGGRDVTSTRAKTAVASTSRGGAVRTVYGAPWPATPVVTPDYIYVPASDLAPDPLTAADQCADFGTGCNAEQLCDLWTVGCPPPPATDGFGASLSTGAQP
jgi:hypothetical protein